jgi:hypothetical protein
MDIVWYYLVVQSEIVKIREREGGVIFSSANLKPASESKLSVLSKNGRSER